MSKNKTLERDLVLKPCLNLCDWLVRQNIILQYRRLDVFDKSFIDGSPDIELHIPIKDTLWILMAECKKPVGGVWSSKQKAYKQRYNGLVNVVYVLVHSREELHQAIEDITGYQKKQDAEMERTMGI
jgi:hypothetical protein